MEKSDRMSSRDIGEVARLIFNSITWCRFIGDYDRAKQIGNNLEKMVLTKLWRDE